MYLFKIALGFNKEFSVIGIADIANRTAKFQGQLNGIPFCQSKDYELVRARVMRAVSLNQPEKNGN